MTCCALRRRNSSLLAARGIWQLAVEDEYVSGRLPSASAVCPSAEDIQQAVRKARGLPLGRCEDQERL
jgi:hypothetical protein